MIAALLLILAIVAYSCSQLQQHGKLRWGEIYDFWGVDSDKRKYKMTWTKDDDGGGWDYNYHEAPDNVYYRFFKIKYKERFPLSTTFLVFLTDGYHLMQFIFFLSLSLSFTLTLGFTWVKFGLVWGGIHVCHFLAYKLLSR